MSENVLNLRDEEPTAMSVIRGHHFTNQWTYVLFNVSGRMLSSCVFNNRFYEIYARQTTKLNLK